MRSGLGFWDYGWVFFFGFGFSQILFCVLNTHGKEDFNQLECWVETNTTKRNRDKWQSPIFPLRNTLKNTPLRREAAERTAHKKKGRKKARQRSTFIEPGMVAAVGLAQGRPCDGLVITVNTA